MTDEQKDRAIVEWLGECWHEWKYDSRPNYIKAMPCICGEKHYQLPIPVLTTWPGFGWLWERMQKREEYMDFVVFSGGHVDVDFDRYVFDGILHPPLFRDAVYNFITVEGK